MGPGLEKHRADANIGGAVPSTGATMGPNSKGQEQGVEGDGLRLRAFFFFFFVFFLIFLNGLGSNLRVQGKSWLTSN